MQPNLHCKDKVLPNLHCKDNFTRDIPRKSEELGGGPNLSHADAISVKGNKISKTWQPNQHCLQFDNMATKLIKFFH